jgi:urease accessory protein
VLQARSWLPRTQGSVRLECACRRGCTRLEVVHQSGAARVRFPRSADAAPLEGVLVNTAGGLTGGDRLDIEVALRDGAEATLTTAAAEKIYRAREGDAAISIRLMLGAHASLAWLPQATILFDGSRLHRRTEVHLAGSARFLAVEILLFGRQAMGEDMLYGACHDAWRIQRDGALAFADTFRLGGPVAGALDRPATLGGARAMGMLIYVADDAAGRLEKVRTLLNACENAAGASAWNGLLVARTIGLDGRSLLRDIAAVAEALSGRPMPRVWHC